MSESIEPTPDDNEDSGLTVTEPVHDLYLQLMIRLLAMDETGESNVPVTLVVSGGVVHGQLITHDAWKTAWEDALKDATGSGAEIFRTFPAFVDGVLDRALDEELGADREKREDLPRFVHLRDAQIVTGAANTSIRTPLWRGRLDHVVGWTVGRPTFE